MKEAEIGKRYQIQCYKHNGRVHRAWSEAVLLDKTNEFMVFGNNHTVVTEAGGNTWSTKEPAIMYFFYNHWFNIIAQLKKDGLYYYCNIATPFIIEEDTIKYIDYDLDLRIFPTGEYKILDFLEYKHHRKNMHYSEDLDRVIRRSLDDLIALYRKKFLCFQSDIAKNYYQQYIHFKEKNKNSDVLE